MSPVKSGHSGKTGCIYAVTGNIRFYQKMADNGSTTDKGEEDMMTSTNAGKSDQIR